MRLLDAVYQVFLVSDLEVGLLVFAGEVDMLKSR